jgi:hypothetical protein
MLSKPIVALAVLAFSFVVGASPSYAQEVATIACPAPALDIAADVAEELDVFCQSRIEVSASDVADVVGPFLARADDTATTSCPAPTLDIVADLAEELDVLCQSRIEISASDVADQGGPVAIEGLAIRVEITQSVTVAALGEAFGDDRELTTATVTLQ